MLRGVSAVAVVAAVVAAAVPARAQQPDAPAPRRLGVDLGLQIGLGVPLGRLNESIPLALNKVIFSMVPIAVDAAYRVDDRIAVGLRLQYGILQFREADGTCTPEVNCRGSHTAVTAHVTLHVPVPWSVVPWLRLGAGYEWLLLRSTGESMGAAADVSLGLRGWMFGLAEVGAETALLPRLAVGPFLGLSVGRYNFGSDGVAPERALVYKVVHEWLMFGVRGAFTL